jgi:hypothetical protein
MGMSQAILGIVNLSNRTMPKNMASSFAYSTSMRFKGFISVTEEMKRRAIIVVTISNTSPITKTTVIRFI